MLTVSWVTPSICLPAIGIKGVFCEDSCTDMSLGEDERREYPEYNLRGVYLVEIVRTRDIDETIKYGLL